MSAAGTGEGAHHGSPMLRVVAGSPNAEELATVVAVLGARAGAGAVEPPTFNLWARKSRMVRPSLRPGYGAWRGSMMPR